MKKLNIMDVEDIMGKLPYFSAVYEDTISDCEFEDDCFLHIVRKGFRICFYNGQEEGRLTEKMLPRYTKLVEKFLK